MMTMSKSDIPKHTVELFKKLSGFMKPPVLATLSAWADRYRVLSSESSAMPGRWRTDVAPFQREILNAIGDPHLERVVIMSGSQIGKTEALLNVIGYYMHYDPSPIMLVQPTLAMAKTFSKQRLAPMLRDTPVLAARTVKNVITNNAKRQEAINTTLEKVFNGGILVLSGANSPASLASRPIRVLLFDEVDRAPESAGSEGDPVLLAERRTTTFYNRKIVLTSTPTLKGESRIETAYQESTQEKWRYPCPSCGEYQQLSWRRLDFETMKHTCSECGASYGRSEWLSGEGRWIADNPGHPTRGFHLNALVSPWVKWESLVDEFRVAQERAELGDFEKLKVFVNTMLGETWEVRTSENSITSDKLDARREEYLSELPNGVCILTMAVDVQDNRLCYYIMGWGTGKESWGIEYGELWGDPRQGRSLVWTQMDEILARTWSYGNGVKQHIAVTCIDSGGHATQEVYAFCKERMHRNVWAIKGRGGEGIPLVARSMEVKRSRVTLFLVGSDGGKDIVMSHLRVENPGPGYCHFPKGEHGTFINGFDNRFFAGLFSERKVRVKTKNGYMKYTWLKDPMIANEPLDVFVYNLCALQILNPNLSKMAMKAPWSNTAQEKVRNYYAKQAAIAAMPTKPQEQSRTQPQVNQPVVSRMSQIRDVQQKKRPDSIDV